MNHLHLILLIAALVLFILAALNVASPRVNLIAAGLALWLASLLFTGCAGNAGGVSYSRGAVTAGVRYADYSIGLSGRYGDGKQAIAADYTFRLPSRSGLVK